MEKSLRDRAIALRLEWLADDQRKLRNARSNEAMSAAEQRSVHEYWVRRLQSELETLQSMPVDVSDDEVRRAMSFDRTPER